MAQITIGRTGITVEKTGFGALPIQRISQEDAVHLLRKALDNGITYFDTARGYTNSEEKLGAAFDGIRDQVIIATKTGASTGEELKQHLETSLRNLQTDYIDIYQFHNPGTCPRPGDGSGLYEAMEEAKKQGKIRFISITNHRLDVAEEAVEAPAPMAADNGFAAAAEKAMAAEPAVESGLYETLQFPFNYLSTEKELALLDKTVKAGMGFICMKGMSGGLINNSAAAVAWMNQFPEALPIWGVQRETELDEFIAHMKNPPVLTPELQAVIDTDRAQLQGEFCRGCGYCMPCPQGIQINMAARVSLMLRRAPLELSLNDDAKQKMEQVTACVECYQCASRCPYGLDTPKLLKRNYKDYQEVLAGKPLLPHNF